MLQSPCKIFQCQMVQVSVLIILSDVFVCPCCYSLDPGDFQVFLALQRLFEDYSMLHAPYASSEMASCFLQLQALFVITAYSIN